VGHDVSTALEQHPRYIERMAVVAEIESRAALVRDQVLARQQAVDQAARDQEAAIADAVARGLPIPPTPPPPAPADALQSALMLVRAEESEARIATERLVAAIAGDVEAALRTEVAAEMDAVAEHAAAVEASRVRVEGALRTAARVRRAVENGSASITRPSRADRTRSHIVTADLLDMARTGADPLEPQPVGHREPRILGVLDGDDHVPTRGEHEDAMFAALPAQAQDQIRRRLANAGQF